MRRSRILTIVLATAILALLAGTAIGHYVVPDSKGRSAACIILSNDLKKFTYVNVPSDNRNPSAQRILDQYNEECR